MRYIIIILDAKTLKESIVLAKLQILDVREICDNVVKLYMSPKMIYTR